ncbi:MAG: TetR/AcrR family transcriptional regulator [Gemmatimonadetes bacterium]|nr:TetR/AcrR family transcriptional regulator [Gemmatimonadota bacterium]
MNPKHPVPERLLSAAGDLFARHGFDAASVRQITSRAKANLGAITYHFGSKEALFHAVLDRVGARMSDRFVAIAAERGTPLERIGRIVTMVLTEDNLPAPTLILRELANDRPLPPPLVLHMRRNFGAMIALIRDGQRDGTIRDGDPPLLAMSVMAQPFLMRIASRIPRDIAGVDGSDPDTRRRLVKHVVTTITRSLATTPGDRP